MSLSRTGKRASKKPTSKASKKGEKVTSPTTVPRGLVQAQQTFYESSRFSNPHPYHAETPTPEQIMLATRLASDLAQSTKLTNPKDVIGSDKLPMSLVPGSAKAYMALAMLEGMLKYGLVNWREAGVRTSIYLDALERHYEKYKNGEWADPKTKVPHLANIMACCGIILDARLCGKLVDDRPKSAPVAGLIDELAETVKHLKETFKDHHPKHYTIEEDHDHGGV